MFNSTNFSFNLGKLDKHEEMAHCDISFHTQMTCLLHIAIMDRPLQALMMVKRAGTATKETAILLQAWIRKMFLLFLKYDQVLSLHLWKKPSLFPLFLISIIVEFCSKFAWIIYLLGSTRRKLSINFENNIIFIF